MNKCITNALRIINTMDWNVLNCHDRALAIAASNYDEELFWFFLICNYTASNFLKKYNNRNYHGIDCYSYIEKVSNTVIKRHTVLRNEMVDRIIQCNSPCVVIVNNWYREGTKHFLKKHHPHFVVIQSIDLENGRAEIVDEIIDNQYWRPENFKNGVVYQTQMIGLDELLALTNETSAFAKQMDFRLETDGDQYAFFYSIEKGEGCHCSPLATLLHEIKNLIATQKEHIEYIKSYLEEFVANMHERYSDFPNIDSKYLAKLTTNDPNGIKNKLYFPFEWKVVEYHYSYLKRFVFCGKYLLNGYSFENNEELCLLIKRYEKIQTQLCLYILKKDNTAIKCLINQFVSLYSDEMLYFAKNVGNWCE